MSTFVVVDVVHFVENHPRNLAEHFRVFVKRTLQNLGRHDDALRVRLYGNVAGEDADVVEFLFEFSVLLIGKSFYRRSVNDSFARIFAERDCVLGDDGFAGTCVRTNEDVLS